MVHPVGDAYRYTLQPIYHNIYQSFHCHLRPTPVPQVLYQLWFYITVPGTGFETDRLYSAVSPQDVVSLAGQVARHRVEFVTVDSEPAPGADASHQLVLRASRSAKNGAGWRYTTRPVSATAAARRRRPSSWFHLQHVTDNVVVTATTFAKPFAHSTSTWVAGGDDETATRCYRILRIYCALAIVQRAVLQLQGSTCVFVTGVRHISPGHIPTRTFPSPGQA